MPLGSVRPMNEPRMTSSLSGLPRAFAHPLYWVALGLLLVNDHVLKGAGIAPAWLAGKLSDFAGLIVAPPVLAAALLGLLGARRAKLIAFTAPALVGLGFAAIKLDAAAAHHAEQLFRALGVASRIWLDPTDLFALAMLPIAAMLCRPAPSPRVRRDALPGVLRVPAVVVASFACIATTGGGEEVGSGSGLPALINETEETLIVHIASTNGAGGCRIYREDRVGVLTPDAFSLRRQVVVAAGGSAALTGDPAVAFNNECGAAWITLPDGRQELVYFADLPKIEEGTENGAGLAGRKVTLRGETNRFRFELGEDLDRFELSSEPVEGNCTGRAPEYSVEATGLALAPGFYDLESATRDEDGCLVVTWVAQTSNPVMDEQRLCIPEWAFPFEEGETLSVIEEAKGTGARRLRITRYDDDNRLNQQLTIWNHIDEPWDAHVKELVAEDCVGSVLECGAYARPVQVELPGDEGVIVSGDEADFNTESDEIRLLVGAGQEIGWSAAACSGDEARTGLSVNLLELRTD
jgi:hypothetical protein